MTTYGAFSLASVATSLSGKHFSFAALVQVKEAFLNVVLILCFFCLDNRYDFAVYGLLAPEIGQCFFPKSSRELQLINSFGIYLAAFLMRYVRSQWQSCREKMTTVLNMCFLVHSLVLLFDTPDHWVLSCSAKWVIEFMVAGLLWLLASS